MLGTVGLVEPRASGRSALRCSVVQTIFADDVEPGFSCLLDHVTVFSSDFRGTSRLSRTRYGSSQTRDGMTDMVVHTVASTQQLHDPQRGVWKACFILAESE
ncbi:hypothetical protein V3C99_003386 [Haemonchus contortus]